MTVNERFIKISKTPISHPLELESSFQIILPDGPMNFEVVKEEKKPNQDGTYDVIYSLKHLP